MIDDAESNFQLGLLYDDEKNYEKNYEKAFEYYKLSADAGHPAAQNNLAVCYLVGYGTPRDLQKALKYYELSAKQGNDYAQHTLGICYMYGRGVSRDNKMAIQCFKLSIAQGNKRSCFNLGSCYEKMSEYKKAIESFMLCNGPGPTEDHIEKCKKKLVERFDILSHINDILYMYPLCVKHKHSYATILKDILTRKYTESIPLITRSNQTYHFIFNIKNEKIMFKI